MRIKWCSVVNRTRAHARTRTTIIIIINYRGQRSQITTHKHTRAHHERADGRAPSVGARRNRKKKTKKKQKISTARKTKKKNYLPTYQLATALNSRARGRVRGAGRGRAGGVSVDRRTDGLLSEENGNDDGGRTSGAREREE